MEIISESDEELTEQIDLESLDSSGDESIKKVHNMRQEDSDVTSDDEFDSDVSRADADEYTQKIDLGNLDLDADSGTMIDLKSPGSGLGRERKELIISSSTLVREDDEEISSSPSGYIMPMKSESKNINALRIDLRSKMEAMGGLSTKNSSGKPRRHSPSSFENMGNTVPNNVVNEAGTLSRKSTRRASLGSPVGENGQNSPPKDLLHVDVEDEFSKEAGEVERVGFVSAKSAFVLSLEGKKTDSQDTSAAPFEEKKCNNLSLPSLSSDSERKDPAAGVFEDDDDDDEELDGKNENEDDLEIVDRGKHLSIGWSTIKVPSQVEQAKSAAIIRPHDLPKLKLSPTNRSTSPQNRQLLPARMVVPPPIRRSASLPGGRVPPIMVHQTSFDAASTSPGRIVDPASISPISLGKNATGSLLLPSPTAASMGSFSVNILGANSNRSRDTGREDSTTRSRSEDGADYGGVTSPSGRRERRAALARASPLLDPMQDGFERIEIDESEIVPEIVVPKPRPMAQQQQSQILPNLMLAAEQHQEREKKQRKTISDIFANWRTGHAKIVCLLFVFTVVPIVVGGIAASFVLSVYMFINTTLAIQLDKDSMNWPTTLCIIVSLQPECCCCSSRAICDFQWNLLHSENHLSQNIRNSDNMQSVMTDSSQSMQSRCVTYHRADINVLLTVADEVFNTTAYQYASGQWTSSESSVGNFLSSFIVGNSYQCWYNPNMPTQVKFDSDYSPPNVSMIAPLVTSVLFIIICCCGVCFSRRIYRRFISPWITKPESEKSTIPTQRSGGVTPGSSIGRLSVSVSDEPSNIDHWSFSRSHH